MSLKVEHINKWFGQLQVIKDLSMEVEEGALFGFLGPNGAGKTTTVRMILDIFRPESGRITWDGKPVSEVERCNWGYLPEEGATLMLVRLALGTVAWWEFVLTIGLMLLTILVLMVFAARLYRYGVLMYGQKPGLGQLVKMVRMK